MSDTSSVPTLRLKTTEKAAKKDCLIWEKELLGLYLSGHPLDKHRAVLDKQKMQLKELKEKFPRGVQTVIAGFLDVVKPILTKKGEQMLFGTVSDYTGSIEIVAFPKILKEYPGLFIPGSCLMLKGSLNNRNGEASFVVEKAKLLA